RKQKSLIDFCIQCGYNNKKSCQTSFTIAACLWPLTIFNMGGIPLFSILKEHQHNWKQIAMLARTELKKDYKGSFLGSAWALVKPLFTLFIYWFAFDVGLR